MRINEDSEAIITVRPIDRNGAVFTPGAVRYRLDDFSSREAIIAWTSATPSTEIKITIPGTSNDIKNNSLSREKKVLTVETDTGTSSQHSDEYFYWVKNLQFK